MVTPSRSPFRRELFLALAEAKLAGRSHRQVAADAGIDRSTLSRILLGRREYAHRPPARDRCEAIAGALGREPTDLFPDLERADAANAT